jgi:hypothetical protein
VSSNRPNSWRVDHALRLLDAVPLSLYHLNVRANGRIEHILAVTDWTPPSNGGIRLFRREVIFVPLDRRRSVGR